MEDTAAGEVVELEAMAKGGVEEVGCSRGRPAHAFSLPFLPRGMFM